ASVGAYSAEWVDFLVRHDRHGSESFVFLGWATPTAALFGLAVLCRSRRWLLAVVLGLGVAIPMLLALGTNTPLYRPVRAVVPGLQYPRAPRRTWPATPGGRGRPPAWSGGRRGRCSSARSRSSPSPPTCTCTRSARPR